MNPISIPYFINIIFVLVLSGLFVAPLIVDQELHDPTRMGKIFFFAQWMLILIPIGLIIGYLNRKQPIDKLSLIVLAWGVWIITRGKIGGIWNDEKFFWFSGCFIFYFLSSITIRKITTQNWEHLMFIPSVSICIIAAVEATLGILQLYGMHPLHHAQFKITGTFFNPAPYAGFLVASLPWALRLTAAKQHTQIGRAVHWLGYLSACLVVVAIASTQSRAAYLGLGAVLLVWLIFNYHPLLFLKQVLNTTFKRIFAYIGVSLLVGCVFYALYLFKEESASGRILIWKVVLRTITEQPLTGHGFNTVQANLIPAQADYFAEGNTNEIERMLAGSTQWAFNEFLQITSEVGLIGLALFLFIIGHALFNRTSSLSRQQKLTCGAARETLAGTLVFGCFSYPFYSLPIMLLFFFSLVILSATQKNALSKSESGYFAILRIPILIGSLCLFLFYIAHTQKLKKAYWLWQEAKELYQIGASDLAMETYAEAYPFLENNGLFLQQYSKCLVKETRYDQAIDMLKHAKCYYSDEFSNVILGNCYQELGDFSKAEEQYLIANNIIPHKFYPSYLLAKMYDKLGQTKKAHTIAKALLSKEVKIASQAIDEIKKEMKLLIFTKKSLQVNNQPREKRRKPSCSNILLPSESPFKKESEVK